MKAFNKNNLLLLLPTLVCGVACMLLRFVMMVYGLDDRGLLMPWHPAVIGMWLVSAGCLIWLALRCRRLPGKPGRTQRFSPSVGMGLCSVAAGVIAAVLALESRPVFRMLPGILAGGCMIATGLARIRGKKTHYGWFLLICVYFVMQLLQRYQDWRADPQLQDYVFGILAGVTLMLAAFHRACAEAGSDDARRGAFTGLAACFFCIVSLSDPEQPLYYAAGALWALSAVGNLNPRTETERREPHESAPDGTGPDRDPGIPGL